MGQWRTRCQGLDAEDRAPGSSTTLTSRPSIAESQLFQAIFKMIPPEEQKALPDDENTPQKRADKLWAFFGKGDAGKLVFHLLSRLRIVTSYKIAEKEFIEGVMKNEAIMGLIQYTPKENK
ncbi:hypothetical protein E2320_003186 [Naja naja]|nr:hypothetical protein E2320_003186 [Naja naja]